MICSMTGYGAAEHTAGGYTYTLEVRSLNNRYYKAAIKLSDVVQFAEPEVDQRLRAALGRGSISYVLRVHTVNDTPGLEINRATLQQFVNQLCAVDVPEGVTRTLDLGAVAALPGVCQSPELNDDQRRAHGEIIGRLTDQALDQLVAMRQTEGQALRADVLVHCRTILEHLTATAARAPQVVEEYRRKLQSRVNTLLSETRIELDEDVLAREVALYADRCDISEELTRLRSHVEQFTQLCDSTEHAGRKLDFLAQEMLREANTIASKGNDTEIVRRAVEIKSLIDRLKEQVQNVE